LLRENFKNLRMYYNNSPDECSNSSSSKAAASEGPKAYPLGYVEGLNDARTMLEDCFSIRLGNSCNLRHD